MPRNRGCNYTEREKQELLNIVEKYKNIIDNKKTDKINIKKKRECWKLITIEFNNTAERKREVEQVKGCYSNLKRPGKDFVTFDRRTEYVNNCRIINKNIEQIFQEVEQDASENLVTFPPPKRKCDDLFEEQTKKNLENETKSSINYNNKRIELLNLQIKQEIEEHELKMRILNLQAEIKQAELKIKLKELDNK